MNFRVASAPVALALALSAGACAAPAPDDAESSSSEVHAPVAPVAPATQARTDVQFLPRVPDAVVDANVAKFRARNGAEWAPPVKVVSMYANVYTGHLESMRRSGPYGQDVALTEASAAQVARDFLLQNADVLGLTPAQINAAKVKAHDVSSPRNDYAWTVSVSGTFPQPGYEAFENLATRIGFSVSIGRDGTPRNLHGTSTQTWPELTLTTTPANPATSPVVLSGVLGRDLTWYYPDPTPYDTVNDAPAPDHVGEVKAEDISAVKPVIALQHEASGVTLRLAWLLQVSKGGHDWSFQVDTLTGEVVFWGPTTRFPSWGSWTL